MSLIELNIVSPRRKLYSNDVKMVIAKAESGEIGVMAGHIPMLASLAPGVLRAVLEDGVEERIVVSGGFLEVSKSKITVLARTAEWPDEIDIERALAAKKRAEERLEKMSAEKVDEARARAALNRAIARINVTKD